MEGGGSDITAGLDVDFDRFNTQFSHRLGAHCQLAGLSEKKTWFSAYTSHGVSKVFFPLCEILSMDGGSALPPAHLVSRYSGT